MAMQQAAAPRSDALEWARGATRPDGVLPAFVELDGGLGGPSKMDDAVLWPASLVLLRHVERMEWRGKRVLELGAGAGHLSVGLARLGARVTATEGPKGMDALSRWSKRLLSEWPGGGAPLQGEPERLSAGGACGGSLRLRQLWWGSDCGIETEEPFDVVLLSEVVYDEDCHEALLQTLALALRPGAHAWSVYCDRPFSMNFFLLLHDAGFGVEQVEPEELCGLDPEQELHMHRITPPAATAAP